VFKREKRYLVFKKSDLTEEQLSILTEWCKTVQAQRLHKGKDVLESLVVESDWPEFEPTWDAIQLRMEYPLSMTPQAALESMDHPTLLETTKRYYQIINILEDKN
jgi:hypothetical protein